jgi:SanA protein
MKTLIRHLKKIFSWIICLFVLLLLLIFCCYQYVETSTQDLHFNSLEKIAPHHAALVLGCSPKAKGGNFNLFFQYRINAAAELFHAQKVKYLIVSGDNQTRYYDEPTEMKKALIAKGVPAAAIYCDYAGLRTLDSVIRCAKIFNQYSFIIVSQAYHTKRAIFIASHHDIYVVGYNAQDVAFSPSSYGREWLARVLVVWNILVGTQPKFLGDPVELKPYS